MSDNECALAVTAWVNEVLPELAEARHWVTMQKTRLPDAVVDVEESGIALEDSRFSRRRIQQAALKVFEVAVLLMVEHNEGDEPDRVEQEQLRDFADRLQSSLLSDGTLGSRVQMASPLVRFTYRLPFVQYQDGTRGRQLTVNFPVAELVPAGGGVHG